MKFHIACLLVLFACLSPHLGVAQLVKPFTEEEVGGPWSNPVLVTFDDNGTGYVVERHGFVWLLDEEGNKSQEPFLDISEEVAMFGDHGLLGFALDPEFTTNHHVYLLYVVDRHHLLNYGTPDYDPNVTIIEQATIGRVTRYTADESTGFTTVDTDSRKVLVGATIDSGFPVLMASHGVGSLAFGTDGTLLASCGEAGSFLSSDKGSAPETYYEQALEDGILKPKENVGSFRSQLIDCLGGKVIRIDPETGAGIASNPFYNPNDPYAAESRVWLIGLRQPYRFFLRPETGSHNVEDADPGELYIGDVGGGRYEELNIAPRGGMNFGWPVFEGYERAWPFQDPSILNVDESNPLAGGNCEPFFPFLSLVQQPIESGTPFFANPCSPEQAISQDTRHFVHSIPAMSWSNELYNKPTRAFVPGWSANGTLRPLDLANPESGVAGEDFEGSSAMPGFFYTGDQFPEEYRNKLFIADFTGWIRVFDISEDHRVIAVDTFHTDVGRIVDLAQNPANGSIYYVNFFDKVVRINFGGNAAPQPSIEVDKQFGPGPLTVKFDASASFDPNGDPLNFNWSFGDGTTGSGVQVEHIFNGNGGQPVQYDVVLTATDTADASRTAEIVISVDNTPPVVDITSIIDGQLYSQTGTNAIPLKASVSDAEHTDDDLSYSWQVFLHHNDHFHPEFPIQEKEAHAALPPTGCTGETYYYRVALTVTDGAGLEGYDEVFMYPYCGTPIIEDLIVEATPESDRVTLDWTYNSGEDIESFDIERAEKFGFFEKIANVDVQITSFVDQFPLQGESVYRIKAVRQDSFYAYSNNVDVDLESVDYSEPYRIFPNPVEGGVINFYMPRTSSNSITFELYTAAGQQVLTRIWGNANPDSPLEETVNVSNYISAMYYFVVRDGDNTHRGAIAIVR